MQRPVWVAHSTFIQGSHMTKNTASGLILAENLVRLFLFFSFSLRFSGYFALTTTLQTSVGFETLFSATSQLAFP
jgi:hypothetical protein